MKAIKASGASMNYDFSQKRHWRRSMWNCIAERLPVPKSEAVVLYLAGVNDEDREVAIRKGFRGNNLIAVERDDAAAAALRAKGVLTLVGDAFDHLAAWRDDRPVHAVVLDLCGGLTDALAERVESLVHLPHLAGAAIAINMLRGRDASGNALRAYLSESRQRILQDSFEFIHEESRAVRLGIASEDQMRQQFVKAIMDDERALHRGSLLKHLLQLNWLSHALMVCGAMNADLSPTRSGFDGTHEAKERFGMMLKKARFQTLTYRSTARQTFDTLVYVNAVQAGGIFLDDNLIKSLRAQAQSRTERRQQAAVWAHRTMRFAA